MHSLIALVSNIHCSACATYIRDVLSSISGLTPDPDISPITQSVRVGFDSNAVTPQSIVDALSAAAFDVRHITVFSDGSIKLQECDFNEPDKQDRTWLRAQQTHVQHCDACQGEHTQEGKVSRTHSSSTTAKLASSEKPTIITVDVSPEDDNAGTWIASVSVAGMTCGSCVGTVNGALEELPYVRNVNIDLLNNGGTIEFVGKDKIDQILERLDDLGYPATVVGLSTPRKADTYSAQLSIEGMTCGSCVGTITEALRDLPYVGKVNVDLLGHTGTIEFGEKENVDQILEKLDELGYPATLVTMTALGSKVLSQQRVVTIQIDNMHCVRCPERIIKAIQALKPHHGTSNHVDLSHLPTLDNPRIEITYTPSQIEGITVRRFISVIEAVDPAFHVLIYHPPTLEERSKRLQNRERLAIFYRMIFTGIIAIPSLIIGVILMALVPTKNKARVWFEEPIWAGNATRMEWSLFILTTPVMLFGTDIFHRRAAREIWAMWKPKSKTPLLRRFYRFGSMNMLISVATIVAYFASLAVLAINASTQRQMGHMRAPDTYFDVITFLTFFILIGRFIEAYSKAKTGDAVAMLAKLRPTTAMLVHEDDIENVSVDQLELRDVVRIPRGHSPPADGLVQQNGVFSFNESSLTGESRPVPKEKGDTVFTGTVNVADPIDIVVTELGGSSMLDRIIEVVRGGQAKRAPIERFADRVTGYFVPVITLLAIVTWLIWLALGLSGTLPDAWLDSEQGGWPFWTLQFAIAVFVVACPCGIGLAAPTALFVGGGLAAKQGILVQGGGQAFQEASNIDAIVFDKTGTLTQGQMAVTSYEHFSKDSSRDVIFALAKAMEASSSHPIAQAVAAYCTSSSKEINLINIKEIPGRGMTAQFTHESAPALGTFKAAIGNEKLLEMVSGDNQSAVSNHGQDLFVQDHLFNCQSQGQSVAIVAIQQPGKSFQVAGVFALSDPLRPEATDVVASLQDLGLSVHLCTGDNVKTANAIASQLKIPAFNVRAAVLPQGKSEYIHELQHPLEGGRKLIAFVGDGLNDTPALTAADVSISLSSGSDIAINASSFILLNSDLRSIRTLVTLSKRVFRRVKLNFFWAAIYNLTLIPVAAGVFFAVGANDERSGWRMSPVWAGVAMAGSSVSVVLSSLALQLPEVRWSRR